MMIVPGCMHCFNPRSYHCEWPYEKARALWDKIMEEGNLSNERFPPDWVDRPLLVMYASVYDSDGIPYIVCGPVSYAFPNLVRVVA